MSAVERVFEREKQSFRVIELAWDRQAFANFFPPSQTRLLSFDDLRKFRRKLFSSSCTALQLFHLHERKFRPNPPIQSLFAVQNLNESYESPKFPLFYFFLRKFFHYIKFFDEQPTSFRHPMSYDNFYEFNKFPPMPITVRQAQLDVHGNLAFVLMDVRNVKTLLSVSRILVVT